MPNKVITFDVARRRLDLATEPREVKDIAFLSESTQDAARRAGHAREEQQRWAQLHIWAVYRLGQMLRDRRVSPLSRKKDHNRLVDILGMDEKDEKRARNLSSRAKKVFEVGEPTITRYIATALAKERSISADDCLEFHARLKRGQFYTRASDARRAWQITQEIVAAHDIKVDIWVETSVGQGAFLDLLPAGSIGIEIDPPPGPIRDNLIVADFLKYESFEPGIAYAAVGNPPWPENGPVRFINRCAELGFTLMAFLVPPSLTRPHSKNQLDQRYSLLYEKELPMTHFRFGHAGAVYPSVLQIWALGEHPRELERENTDHPDFEFLSRRLHHEADIVMRRIGPDAGLLVDEANVASDTCHWIRIRAGDPQRVRTIFESLDFSDPKFAGVGWAGRARDVSQAAVVEAYQLEDAWERYLRLSPAQRQAFRNRQAAD